MKPINKKGITLVELVIVFVIIAIGAVLLVPNIGTWLPNFRLRGATRDVASILRTAQMKAVSTNIPYGVAFDDHSYQLYRSSGGLIPEGSVVTLPNGVEFKDNTFPVNGDLNKHFAEFNPNSTSSTGGVSLLNNKGAKKKITLTAATGRVKIE